MNYSFKNLYTGIFIVVGLFAMSCNSNNGMREKEIQDSLYQDSLRQDSLRLDSVETPVEDLLEQDSLNVNNRGLRTP